MKYKLKNIESKMASLTKTKFLIATIFLITIPPLNFASQTGFPFTPEVCVSMSPPAEEHPPPPQTSLLQYSIKVDKTVVIPGEKVTLSLLSSAKSGPFIGFLAIGRFENFQRDKTPKGKFLGEKEPVNLAQVGDCIGVTGSAMTHTSYADKKEIQIVWEAPQELGEYVIAVTFMANETTFWAENPSEVITVISEDATTSPTTEREIETTSNDRIVTGTTLEPTPEVGDLKKFYEGCSSSDSTIAKGCFGTPSNCIEGKNCEMLITFKRAADQIRFELAGKVSGAKAYVAFGISLDASMGDDSVIGCRLQNNQIFIDEYYNLPSKANAGVVRTKAIHHFPAGSYADGYIACKFSMDGTFSVPEIKQSFNLLDTEYFLLLSRGTSSSKSGLGRHALATDREVSSSAINFSSTSTVGTKSKILIQLHGSLMIFAWLFFAPSGMFTARFLKQTHTDKKPFGMALWFQVHRTCMILTVTFTIIAFILIFVEIKDFTPTATDGKSAKAHAILGIILTALALAQVVVAYFRPHPGTKNRGHFNWFHFVVGNASHIIGAVTIQLANTMSKSNLQSRTRYNAAFSAFIAIHIIARLVVSYITYRNAKGAGMEKPHKILSFGVMKQITEIKGDVPHTNLISVIAVLYMIAACATSSVLVSFVIDALKS